MASPAFQLVAILTLALLPPVYSISVLWIGWCLFSNVFVFCTVLMSSFFLSFWGKLQPMISEFRVPLLIFAGNSYTYYNDLPTIVSKLAEAAGEGYEFDSHLEVSPLSSEPFWYILIKCHMLYSVYSVCGIADQSMCSYLIFHTSCAPGWLVLGEALELQRDFAKDWLQSMGCCCPSGFK